MSEETDRQENIDIGASELDGVTDAYPSSSEPENDADEPAPLTLESEEVPVIRPQRDTAEPESEEEEDDEGEEEDTPTPEEDTSSLAYILGTRVVRRSGRQAEGLKKLIGGKIALEVTDVPLRLVYDWEGDDLQVKELEKPVDLQRDDVRCVLKMTERAVRAICTGELNPQIALLSDKIRMQGSSESATYFFNLLVPRKG